MNNLKPVDELKPDESLDLQGVLCPTNFVKAKLQLEEMEEGQLLELVIDDGEPIRNVPRSLKSEGHRVLKVEQLENGAFKLLVRRGEE